MATKTTKELLGRWEKLKHTRTNHENTWDEIVRLMQPFRGDIRTKRSEGQKRIGAVFDSTASQAADAFVNFLKGSLIPAGSDWIRLRALPPFDRDMEIKEALDKTSDRVMSALADSNFYVEAASFLKDFAVIGNGTMLVSEDQPFSDGSFRGLVFEAVPIMRMWWQNGHKKRPFIMVREFEMPALDAIKFFGADQSPTAETFVRRGKDFDDVSFAHFVWENEDGVPGGTVVSENKPWQSAYVDVKAKQTIREGGFDYVPYVVSRWMTVDGEEYGRGRGHLARPDAKGANELRAQMLMATAKFLDPPLVLEEDGLLDGDVAPGGTMYIRPWQKQAPDYLTPGNDLRVAQEMLNQDRENIRRAFLADIFEDPDTQPRSAEESRQRLLRTQQRLAAPAESVDYDFATPLMESVIGRMMEAGALPELEELVKNQVAEFEVVFQSPFFSAQKNSQVQRVYSFVTRRIGLFQATQDPAWVDDLDPDQIRKLDAELSDVPAEIFRDEETIEARRQARAARAAEERAAAAQGQGRGPGRPAANRNPVPAQNLEELS